MEQPTPVHATRRSDGLDPDSDLQRVRHLAKLLDAQFQIAGIPIGYDSIIGLVPVVGDTISAAISLYPIYLARRHGLGKLVLARMAGNVAVDWLIGTVPLIGDLFDVAFKANLRNLALF